VREGERREDEERGEREFVFCPRKKEEKSAPTVARLNPFSDSIQYVRGNL